MAISTTSALLPFSGSSSSSSSRSCNREVSTVQSLFRNTLLSHSLSSSSPSSLSSPRRCAVKSAAIKCQAAKKEDAAPIIPSNQLWMFEESQLHGSDIWNKTWYPKAADQRKTEKTWYIVDATNKVLGRLASTIAVHIRGKQLATYTPSVDMGAYVVVVNAEKVAVTGKKRTQKLYKRHSGRPGGMKVETFDHLQNRIPERIIEHAVRGMLPKGRLGRRLFTNLKVYKGANHPHEAQQPIPLPIRDKKMQLEE